MLGGVQCPMNYIILRHAFSSKVSSSEAVIINEVQEM